MTKWTLVLAALLVTGVGVAARAAFATDGHPLHGHLGRLLHGGDDPSERVGEHLDQMATMLELDAAQRKRIGAALVRELPALEARAAALADAHARLFALTHAPGMDDDALKLATAALGAATDELAFAAARLVHESHGVLKPEQRAKLAELHGSDAATRLGEHVRLVGRAVRTWAERQ